uniref:Putative upstream-binding factor 1-like protein 3/5 n=1 Tax=Stegastes partitus TaxID=144197 RepID=A0A3B5ABQ7_9TELE
MSDDKMETEEPGWTRADLQKLLGAMKASIPENEKMDCYTNGLKRLDWNKVAFPPFSPEACKQKWTNMLKKMSKVRTLTELIVRAEDVIADPAHNRKGEEFTEDEEGLPPRPPPAGYNLFCKEQLMCMTGSSGKTKVKACAQRWRVLSSTEKDKYRTNCKELNRQYRMKLNEYLQRFDKEKQEQILKKNGIKRPKKRKSRNEESLVEEPPGEPKMPSLSGNVIFFKNQMELLKEKIPGPKERLAEASRMWMDLSTKQKEYYAIKVDEKKKKYSLELQKWFKTLTAAEQESYLTRHPKKHQYLKVKLTDVFVRKEPRLSQPSDSEDDDIEFSEEESCWEYEEEEEEEDEEDVMFEM